MNGIDHSLIYAADISFLDWTALVVLGLLIIEVSISHSDMTFGETPLDE